MSLELEDVWHIIEKAAPYLATAITGPLGGIATKIIADRFDANPKSTKDIAEKIKEDDSPHEKLADAEDEYKIQAAKIDQKNREIQDIEDARKLSGMIFRYVLFFTLILLFIGSITAASLVKSDDIKTILLSFAGLISVKLIPMAYKKMIKFFFGA